MLPSGEATLRDALSSLRTSTAPDPKKPRFGEISKFLPIGFILCLISGLWTIYVSCHCLPLMARDETYMHGWSNLVVWNLVTILVVVCYFRSILQHPGTIPDVTAEGGDVIMNWEYAPQDGRALPLGEEAVATKQTKRLGARRNCKWCNKYKPDRCHHCRVCRMCILKMDHHCPWIYNCVGFKNFKYFFLLVLYAATATHIMLWSMLSTVQSAVHDPTTHFLWMFAILLGETLAGLMAFLLTTFLGFHIYLLLRSMTTIEFCEKSRRPNYSESYSLGLFGNLKAALGDNVFLWLLPICPPSGDGVTFVNSNDFGVPAFDAESSREERRKLQAVFSRYGTTSDQQNSIGAGTGEAPEGIGESSVSGQSSLSQSDPSQSDPSHDVRVVVRRGE